jgi:hypothetical protein
VNAIHCEEMTGDCLAAGTFGFQPGGQFSNINSNTNVAGATVHLGLAVDKGQIVTDAMAVALTSAAPNTILQDDADSVTLVTPGGTGTLCNQVLSLYLPGSIMNCNGGLAFSGVQGIPTTISTTASGANLILQPNGAGAVNVTNTVGTSSTSPTLTVTPSWSSTSGAVDAALLVAPSIAGGSGSLLIDAKVAATSQWKVDQTGQTTQLGPTQLAGITTTPTLGSNVAGFVGPNSSSFTSYLLQLSSSAPMASNVLLAGTPTSGISQLTFGPVTSSQCPTCVVNNAANTGTSAFTLNMNSSNTTNAFQIPSLAGLVSNGNSSMGYDLTNQNTHIPVAGADALAAAEAPAIASNVLPKAANGTQALLIPSHVTDSGTTLTYTGTGGFSSASFQPYPSTNILITGTTPTISSGFGTLPSGSIQNPNGTGAFTIKIGGSTPSTGTIGLPTAASGWNCFATDITSPTTGGGFAVKQTGGSTTTAILTGYNSSGTVAGWTGNDILSVSCFAR